MVTIFEEVFLIDKEIMVSIELPKSAVDDVEMLIGKVPEKQRKCHVEWSRHTLSCLSTNMSYPYFSQITMLHHYKTDLNLKSF